MGVAGLRDLLAMTLKVIGDRGQLRDYFDVMCIEQSTVHRLEHRLSYYLARYGVGPHHSGLAQIVRALGHTVDVEDDPTLPSTRAAMEAFFDRRAPQVLASPASLDLSQGPERDS